jgi:hypothetical protein
VSTDPTEIKRQILEKKLEIRKLMRQLRQLESPRHTRRQIERRPRTPIARTRRPRARRATSPARHKKYADDLFSLIVRTRDGWTCQVETCRAQLAHRRMQAAHGFSRIHWQTRFDESNVWTLCDACHIHFTFRDRDGWTEWMKRRLGEEAYWALYAVSKRDGYKWDGSVIPVLEARAKGLGITDEQIYVLKVRAYGKRALAEEDANG